MTKVTVTVTTDSDISGQELADYLVYSIRNDWSHGYETADIHVTIHNTEEDTS